MTDNLVLTANQSQQNTVISRKEALKEKWLNALYLELKAKPKKKIDVVERLELRHINQK